VPAVVLAGGGTSPAFAAVAGLPAEPGSRALADLHGRPMVAWVLAALRKARLVDRLVLVAPPGFPSLPEADEQVTGDGTLPDNIAAGLARLPGATHALLVTADVPFLTGEAVDDFLRRAHAAGADCCYCGIPLAVCRRRFPEMRRTSVRLDGERVTGGNVVLQRIAAFPRQAEALKEAYRRRKAPGYLVRLIGPANVLRFLLGRLRRTDIEAGASRVLGVACRLILSDYPELGTDVDRPEDLLLARKLLRRSGEP